MEWVTFEGGNSIGQRGSENGIILRDDEHPFGARITLEREGYTAPFTITCGIYGWMMHTRFFGTQQDADNQFERMKYGLAEILDIIPLETDPNVDEKMETVSDAISKFVQQYS
jgi:hypothetical protein